MLSVRLLLEQKVLYERGWTQRQSLFPSYWYCLNKQTTTKTSGWKESSTPELCAYRLIQEKSLSEHCDHGLRAHCATSVFAISLDLVYRLGFDMWKNRLISDNTQSTTSTVLKPENIPCHPPTPAKKLTKESVPPHAAPTIRVLTGVCVRSDYTLATSNTSTLFNHWELNC